MAAADGAASPPPDASAALSVILDRLDRIDTRIEEVASRSLSADDQRPSIHTTALAHDTDAAAVVQKQANSLVQSTLEETGKATRRLSRQVTSATLASRHMRLGTATLANAMRKIAKAHKAPRPWYILHPEESNVVAAWDGVTTAALLFTALVTPVEVRACALIASLGSPCG
jgi:hypothetical protein